MTDLTVAGIRDAGNCALDSLMENWQELPLPAVLTHLVDAVTAQALPHLAAQFHMLHTVAWRRTDNDTVRRGLIKDAIRRHRIKGTLAGFRLAALDADCEVVGAIVPPAKIFTAEALTVAERNAFVARYPQLRIYRSRTVGQRIGIFCGDTMGRFHPVQSDALLRIMPRAWLYRQGQETELTLIERLETTVARASEQSTVTTVAIPGRAGYLSFAGLHPRFLTVTEAPGRFYRMTITDTYMDSSETLRRVTATPGLTPIDVRPDAIAQTGQAIGVHAGRHVAGHLVPSTARDRIYQRLYLFDPAIDVLRDRATLYLDAGRLGMPAHHGELRLRVPGVTSKQTAGRYCRGYLTATGKTELRDCLDSMRDVARASDIIAINTTIQRPVTAGEQVTSGRSLSGDWITN